MQARPSLSVTLKQLPSRWLACFTCEVDQTTGQFSTTIAEGFSQVKQWVEGRSTTGGHPRVIGLPQVAEGRLIAYDCCVEVGGPAFEPPAGGRLVHLQGGLYAVLLLKKDSATLGELIGEFHAEYVPAHDLTLDPGRPSFEVYDETTMEYCAPILGEGVQETTTPRT